MEDIIKLIQANDWYGIQSLINERKFNIDQQDRDGNTALIHAVHYNNVAIVQYLIAAGADVDIKNFQGKTALMEGLLEQYPESVKMLIENGDAKIDEVDQNGCTALMYAVATNNIRTVKLLYTKRAAVLIKHNDCKTAKDLMSDKSDEIKECLYKRVIEIEMARPFLERFMKTNPKLERKISSDDLEILSLFNNINETDFIMAAYSTKIRNPIDIWNNIQNINMSDLSTHDSRCCRTDSEVTDDLDDFHTTRPYNTILEICAIGEVADEI